MNELGINKVQDQDKSSERGYTLVEFALTMPFLILLLMGIFDLGIAVYANNTIANAAREGARRGIVNTDNSVVQQQVISTAPGLGLGTGDITISRGSSSTCVDGIGGGAVTVTVSYTYTPITPLISRIVGNSLILNKTAVMCQE